MQRARSVCLCGNHDLGVLGTIDLLEFSGDAGAAARWTREVLDSDDAHASSRHSSRTAQARGVALFHGSARDPVWEYVLSDEAALDDVRADRGSRSCSSGTATSRCRSRSRDGQLDGGLAPDGTEVDLAGARWLLNPGSVGQPRDGDPRAAYSLLDLDARRASFRRVAYDIARTQARDPRGRRCRSCSPSALALGQ